MNEKVDLIITNQGYLSYHEIDLTKNDQTLGWKFMQVSRDLYDEVMKFRVRGQDVRLVFHAYLESEKDESL